jgi:membrane dipeptidase
MPIIDAHCDVLSKLYMDPSIDFSDEQSGLDASLPKLVRGNVLLQCFAIWIPERAEGAGMDHLLAYAELFREKIIKKGSFRFVRTSEDLRKAAALGKRCALLTMEGADALHGSFSHLRTMFDLGVRCLGLTWNYANWAADGIMEPRAGGLTVKGQKLVQECNDLGIILDVSHLSEAGFWELAELSSKPFIASHSNVKEICPHPRNLTKDQVETIARQGGVIGVNFYPPFLTKNESAGISDVLRHIETLCEWGGEKACGLGSDYDGISRKPAGLEDAASFEKLQDAICKIYSAEQAERILYRNWFEFFVTQLPKSECCQVN